MERTRTSAFCFSEASSEKIDVRDGALHEVAMVPACLGLAWFGLHWLELIRLRCSHLDPSRHVCRRSCCIAVAVAVDVVVAD